MHLQNLTLLSSVSEVHLCFSFPVHNFCTSMTNNYVLLNHKNVPVQVYVHIKCRTSNSFPIVNKLG